MVQSITKKLRSNLRLIALSVSILLAIVVVYFILTDKGKPFVPNPAYAEYIDAYTSGTISKQSVIRVQFVNEVALGKPLGEPIANKVFKFSPSIKGQAVWVDSRTLEFRPDENLQSGKTYTSKLAVGKMMEIPKDLEDFAFQFKIIEPNYEIDYEGLTAFDNRSLDRMKLKGTIITADTEEPKSVEEILSAKISSTNLKIKWQHDESGRLHTFLVDSIARSTSESTLTLNWSGKAIKSANSGSKDLEIPAIGDFKILNVKATNVPQQMFVVQFSDPISTSQFLQGLITINGLNEPGIEVDGSQIKLYAPDRLEGTYTLTVNEGIRNIVDKAIPNTTSYEVRFDDIHPSVSIPGRGVIIPNSGKLTLPFDAVNLKAVDVSIIRIYESNIPQFLQASLMNDVNEYELRRVGKPIARTTIRLDDDKVLNLRKTNRFSLDLQSIIQTEPGAIYRVQFSFKREYALLNCATSGSGLTEDEEDYYDYYENTKLDEDDAFWEEYNAYYARGYRWEDRNNPCTDSYYSRTRWATRNVLASNLGVIAKKGAQNEFKIAVTDLLSTKSIANVEIEALNFQQQNIGTAKTNNDGWATLNPSGTPYLIIAKRGKERGYLRTDAATALSLSRFDVIGEEIQNGLKGFIYGERGVWRPGDSIFLAFMLEDANKSLPSNHPVSLELLNPFGQVVRKITTSQNLGGIYTFATNTDALAPTGNWQAKVTVGGAIFQKSVKIETIQPNRLSIDLNFSGDAIIQSANPAIKLSSKWLFGTDARNLIATLDMTLTSTTTTFPKFKGYIFDDPITTFEKSERNVFNGKLSETGTATFRLPATAARTAPGVLKASFLTKIFEPGGNFSIDQISVPYHVFPSYVGIKLPEGERMSNRLVTGKPHPVNVVLVDTKGERLNENRQVEVSIYKLEWRWWWEKSNENFGNFSSKEASSRVKRENLNLVNGQATVQIQIDYPNWGRYLIRVKDLKTGQITGGSVYIDWPEWSSRMGASNPTEATMLSFTSNKETYAVGEEVTLTIPSAKNGRALVSIENGSKIVESFWVDTDAGQTLFKFKTTPAMAPNVYANVTLLQPHAQTINDLPIRMYGVIPIVVEDKSTILSPTINMATSIKPEQKASITVAEQNGKEMFYTIALVDEGLLSLTRFKTPDPHKKFYAREALGVNTWDMFDNVLGAYGAEIERLLSVGGDGELLNLSSDANKANRFKPVVKFLGPFALKKGQKTTHQVDIPQYVGAVRAMVVASANGAYGFAEKTVQVKNPLMLLATVPRVLRPGETLKLPVTVFATDASIKEVSVNISPNKFIQLVGNATQSVRFDRAGEQVVYFDARVSNQIGTGKLDFTASSGTQKASYSLEVDISNPNPNVVNVTETTLQAGSSWSTDFEAIGSGAKTVLEISSIPAINLEKRLDYLIQYPHGCIEQITSAAFPQLFLTQLAELNGQQKTAIERNIKDALNRLRGFQMPTGGFAYWPGASQADDWAGNYVGHFMLEAQAKGYTLPTSMLQQWLKYQKNKAVLWAPRNFYNDLDQAYRLYTLALAKAPELGAMNRLREMQNLSTRAKWRLAAAYQLAGQTEVAKELINGLSTNVTEYIEMAGTFGSDIRDKAMILETLVLMKDKSKSESVLTQVAAALANDKWMSTQSTAYSLIAVAKYCGSDNATAKINYTYRFNEKSETINLTKALSSLVLNPNSGTINLKNNGNNTLFVRLIRSGKPNVGDEVELPNNPANLRMKVEYLLADGTPIDVSNLSQGTDFMAKVTISNPGNRGDYKQMALSQIFPSGWEIINTRLQDDNVQRGSIPTYQDIRDDRVMNYFDINANTTQTYFVLLNAAYSGKFYLPPVYAEAMYDNSVTAFMPGKWVQVQIRTGEQ